MDLRGKRVVIYYRKDLAGKLMPVCGSDSVLPLDQRLGIGRVVAKAVEHAGKMLHMPDAFRIEVWMDKAVTDFIMLQKEPIRKEARRNGFLTE